MDIDIIKKYFPALTEKQVDQLTILYDLYADWNEKINVIYEKDIRLVIQKHVLHRPCHC
jgi:16S rRNA (guanine527-N7)-methyltransferase